jgi:hypothetical protein
MSVGMYVFVKILKKIQKNWNFKKIKENQNIQKDKN